MTSIRATLVPALLAMSLSSAASVVRAQVVPAADSVRPLAIGQTFVIKSRVLNESRRINVYVPAGYADSIALPVLYMPDGGIGEDFLHIAGLVQISVQNETMRPFILVGIENTERRRDTTGPTNNAEDRKIAPRVGGSAAFRQFIRTELMPVMNARHRTTAERAIIGESLAGLFVVETLLREPDLFDTYIAFDPSLWWNNGALVDSAAVTLRGKSLAGKTLYLATSEEKEVEVLAGRLYRTLTTGSYGAIRGFHSKMPEESHATIYHPAALRALRAVFAPPPPPPRPK